MNNIPDGGPAFPRPGFTTGDVNHTGMTQGGFANTKQEGMSLRDWFAGQIMAARVGSGRIWCDQPEKTAQAAYKDADALIAARGAK